MQRIVSLVSQESMHEIDKEWKRSVQPSSEALACREATATKAFIRLTTARIKGRRLKRSTTTRKQNSSTFTFLTFLGCVFRKDCLLPRHESVNDSHVSFCCCFFEGVVEEQELLLFVVLLVRVVLCYSTINGTVVLLLSRLSRCCCWLFSSTEQDSFPGLNFHADFLLR